MKVKEESENVGLKLNIQKTKIMASSPITLWEIDGETLETVKDFILEGSKITSGEGNGTPLQYSCLENPIDGGACWATVHGVTKSRTRLSDFAFTYLRAGLGPRRSTNHRVTRVTQGRLSFLCTHKHLLFHSQHLTHIPCADHSPETVWLNRGP